MSLAHLPDRFRTACQRLACWLFTLPMKKGADHD